MKTLSPIQLFFEHLINYLFSFFSTYNPSSYNLPSRLQYTLVGLFIPREIKMQNSMIFP